MPRARRGRAVALSCRVIGTAVHGLPHPKPVYHVSEPPGSGGRPPPDEPSQQIIALADNHVLSSESLATAYRRTYPTHLVLSFTSAAECTVSRPAGVAAVLLYNHDADVLNESLLEDVRMLRRVYPAPVIMVLSDAANAADQEAIAGLLWSGADLVVSTRTTPLETAFAYLEEMRARGARGAGQSGSTPGTPP
jgi:hypothetical protein